MKIRFSSILLATNASLLIIGCSPRPSNPMSSDSPTPPVSETKATPLSAENKIEGAFGKKFGDVFDTSSATAKDTLRDGTPIYQFTSDKPLGRFDKYYVLITPSTHRIYSIWATGPVKDDQASNDLDTLMQMLEQKYGPQPKREDSFDDDDRDERKYSQGNRWVSMEVRHRSQQTSIEIRYYDLTLGKLADTEQAEIVKQKAKTLDNSGL